MSRTSERVDKDDSWRRAPPPGAATAPRRPRAPPTTLYSQHSPITSQDHAKRGIPAWTNANPLSRISHHEPRAYRAYLCRARLWHVHSPHMNLSRERQRLVGDGMPKRLVSRAFEEKRKFENASLARADNRIGAALVPRPRLSGGRNGGPSGGGRPAPHAAPGTPCNGAVLSSPQAKGHAKPERDAVSEQGRVLRTSRESVQCVQAGFRAARHAEVVRRARLPGPATKTAAERACCRGPRRFMKQMNTFICTS